MKKAALICLIALTCIGCKQNNWLDWKTQNTLWLENNAKQTGVITTPTGLQYRVIQKGVSPTSPKPDTSKGVVMSYKGTFINGYEFDSATDATNYVSDLVKGFQEGLGKMHEFDEYEFYIPYNLGYGTDGTGTEGTSYFVPPYSTLIFRVYLKSVF